MILFFCFDSCTSGKLRDIKKWHGWHNADLTFTIPQGQNNKKKRSKKFKKISNEKLILDNVRYSNWARSIGLDVCRGCIKKIVKKSKINERNPIEYRGIQSIYWKTPRFLQHLFE